MDQYLAVHCKSCGKQIRLAHLGTDPGGVTLDHPTVPYFTTCSCGAEHEYSLKTDVVRVEAPSPVGWRDRVAWFRPL